jgi:transposase
MERLPMRKVREILRIRWQLQRSVREAALSTGKSVGVVQKTTYRAKVAGLTWEQVEALDDVTLEQRLYGEPVKAESERVRPDPVYLHAELKKPGVTLELLHLEYLEKHRTGYRYTAFCEVYRDWLRRRGLWMRQSHKAGEKTFVDYSGVKPRYIDPRSGEVIEAELFVAVLGASNRTFAEATATQRLPDWIGSHTRALSFFGGATRVYVPDQLRSAVSRPCRYEPDVNRTYEAWAQHCGAVVEACRGRISLSNFRRTSGATSSHRRRQDLRMQARSLAALSPRFAHHAARAISRVIAPPTKRARHPTTRASTSGATPPAQHTARPPSFGLAKCGCAAGGHAPRSAA